MQQKRETQRNDGTELEQLVQLIEGWLIPDGFKVESRKPVYNDSGTQIAELDIVITGKIGSASLRWLIECRDRPSEGPAPGSWIEQLNGRRSRFKFDKVMAVSTTGFAEGAREEAERVGIELRTVEDIDPSKILLWFTAKEMTGFNHLVKFVHVYIKLAAPDHLKVEVHPETLANLRPSFDSYAPVFRRKQDGGQVSFMDIWASFPRDVIYSNVPPDGPKIKRRIRLNFPNSQERFQIRTTSGAADIAYIDVDAELWIKVEKKPLTTVRIYRDDDGTIAQSAEFEFEHMGKKLALDLYQIPRSGDQFVSLRTKEDSDEVNFNVVLICLNDVIREQLEEVAREAKTITYTELSTTMNFNRDIELDRSIINRILRSISKKEHEEGRPLLPAVVISADFGCPDKEFFSLGQELGLYDGEDDLTFFTEELYRVHQYWQQSEAKNP